MCFLNSNDCVTFHAIRLPSRFQCLLQQQSFRSQTSMLGFYLISFQVLVIVLFGIFLRTDTSDISNLDYFSQSSLLLLGFTMYSLNYKQFDWSVLSNLLLVAAVCFQWNALFYAFWTSCLKNSFSSTTSITMLSLLSSLQAILCVLVTLDEFLPKMSHTQVFLVIIVEVIGYSLNFAVERLGIQAVNGGGGMTIFLFAAGFGLMMKLLSYPHQKIKPNTNYFNGSLKLIGVILMVFGWPGFNTMGSLFDADNVLSTANLTTSAFYNTIFCLASAIICSLILQSFGNRIHLHKFSESIFNSGVLISACAGLIIDPFASLLLGVMGGLITVLYEKYGSRVFFRGDPMHLLLFSLLSGLLSSIFAAGRASRSPSLATDCYRLGGLQMACLVVSFGFGVLFGLIAVGCLKLTKGIKDNEVAQDEAFWIVLPDMVPVYPVDKYASYLSTKENKPEEFELKGNPARIVNNSGVNNSSLIK